MDRPHLIEPTRSEKCGMKSPDRFQNWKGTLEQEALHEAVTLRKQLVANRFYCGLFANKVPLTSTRAAS